MKDCEDACRITDDGEVGAVREVVKQNAPDQRRDLCVLQWSFRNAGERGVEFFLEPKSKTWRFDLVGQRRREHVIRRCVGELDAGHLRAECRRARTSDRTSDHGLTDALLDRASAKR